MPVLGVGAVLVAGGGDHDSKGSGGHSGSEATASGGATSGGGTSGGDGSGGTNIGGIPSGEAERNARAVDGIADGVAAASSF